MIDPVFCKRGHVRADNLYVDPAGRKSCRRCNTERARERYHRLKRARAELIAAGIDPDAT